MELFILELAIYIIALPIGVGIWRYSYLDREAKLLLYMLIPVALNQFLANWWLDYIEKNNIPFYHLYVFIETVFIAVIYYSYLRHYRYRIFIPLITAAFLLFYVASIFLNPDKLFVYSTYERAVEGIIVIVFASSYFINVYRTEKIMYLQKTTGFWIGAGLILYFSSNLLLFVFSSLVFAQESAVFHSIWTVHALLTILLYISYTIALSCKKAETTS